MKQVVVTFAFILALLLVSLSHGDGSLFVGGVIGMMFGNALATSNT